VVLCDKFVVAFYYLVVLCDKFVVAFFLQASTLDDCEMSGAKYTKNKLIIIETWYIWLKFVYSI